MKYRLLKFLIIGISMLVFGGCSQGQLVVNQQVNSETEKIFRYGTTAYGSEMGNAGLNPHDNYSGWSAVRYGVGETLFRFTETMELEPWLASGYEQLDEYRLRIDLKEDIYFTSGRKLDAEAVKQCFEQLIATHDRAPNDLKIKEMTAEGQSLTIESWEKVPALLNYLSDPYGAIIDIKAGITETGNVVGTGPFIVVRVSDTEIDLIKNDNYWGGMVHIDRVEVRTITDGDTLTMALQAGEIDAAQGLPYASYEIFVRNQKYYQSSTDTSRTFFATINYQNEWLHDSNLRKAIAMSCDKEGFTKVLLQGNGSVANGPFPANFTFGDNQVNAFNYNPEAAKALLFEAGWEDLDGDGYLEKDGVKLTLRWLTYPGRQELPLLAEMIQANLKEVGIELLINSTASHLNFIETGEWDIYASAFVTAPTGDPAYFFTTHVLADSVRNRGGYYNEEVELLAELLSEEFDQQRRGQIAIEMQELILGDAGFVFISHLQMSVVMKTSVTGFQTHPSDYYEITAQLNVD